MAAATPVLNVLIVGATGLIGSAVAARLLRDGHRLNGISRERPESAVPMRHHRVDVAKMLTAKSWLPCLEGIDAVVYCVGLLQDAPGELLQAVHADAPAALYEACEAAGVRRVVHLSAVGVDRGTPSAFSRTKLAGDQALMARDLDWVILRPAVVIGRSAYGASALMRGLAALPVLPSMSDTGPLQPVHLDDLVETIAVFLRPQATSHVAVEVVGTRTWTFDGLVALFRLWLGWRPARVVSLPPRASRGLFALGDLAGLLGWRPPMRSNAEREIARGATGDPAQWTVLTGLAPRDLEQAFLEEPASVQERWFARLFLVKPLLIGITALFWISTGVIALGPGWTNGVRLMQSGGVEGWPAAVTVIGGALCDILVGTAIAFRRSNRRGLWAGIALTVVYGIIGSVLVPWLWLDPLGPLLKVMPIIVLHVAALAIASDR
jgi:uncharacterized protein YbjT (DUF2867 family)